MQATFLPDYALSFMAAAPMGSVNRFSRLLVGAVLSVCALLAKGGRLLAQTPLSDSAQRITEVAESLSKAGGSANFRRALELHALAGGLFHTLGEGKHEAHSLVAAGDAARDLGLSDSALVLYRASLPLLRSAEDRKNEATASRRIATRLQHLGQLDSATAWLARALTLSREVGDSGGLWEGLHDAGGVYLARGSLDSANSYFRAALPLSHFVGETGEATILNEIGLIFHYQNQLDSAWKYYNSALQVYAKAGVQGEVAREFNNIGGVFQQRGEPDSSLFYYRAALEIRRHIGDRNYIANTLDNIAQEFDNIGRYDSALVYHRDALAIAREIRDREEEGSILASFARTFDNLGMHDSALAYQKAGAASMEETGNRLYLPAALANIGQTYLDMWQLDSAAAYLNRALPLARAAKDRRFEGVTLDFIGLVQRRLGNVDSALIDIQSALAIGRTVGSRGLEIRALGDLAITYAQGNKDLKRAVGYYDSAAALQATLSRRTGSQGNRVAYTERYRGLYSYWVGAWLARAPEVGESTAALGALAAAERGRAQALLDLMRRNATPSNSIADAPAEGRSYLALLSRSGSIGLVYHVSSDTLIAWALSPTGAVRVVRTPMPYDSLAGLVAAFRSALSVERAEPGVAIRGKVSADAGAVDPNHIGARWSAASLTLGRLLLPPQLQEVIGTTKQVVVVAPGVLALVPFAALISSPAGAPFGATIAVRYSPSLATLAEAEARPELPRGAARQTMLREALVVGNPHVESVGPGIGEGIALGPLPGAEAESRVVAARLGAAPLIGVSATETAVRERLPKARLIHFATHGFAYSVEGRSRSSFVSFAADSLNDGRLTVGDLLDDTTLQLSADLVVLSACESGLGDMMQTEGTVGLQRAFLARGARSVIVSLWNVSDEASRLLMERLYKHWLEDRDHPGKAEALRRAQEALRNTPGFEHPRFWAAFQLVGAN